MLWRWQTAGGLLDWQRSTLGRNKPPNDELDRELDGEQQWRTRGRFIRPRIRSRWRSESPGLDSFACGTRCMLLWVRAA